MQLRVPVLLLAGAVLAGCTAVALPGGAGPATSSSSAPSEAAAVIDLTNEERRRAGRAALSASPQLMEAARIHALQMAEHRQAAHTIPAARYPTMQARLQAVGYRYASAAENVAWNQRSAAEVLATWMGSAGHRANILDAGVTEIGAAMARDPSGQPYWIQVFGRPR
jgi:uncharacterized protein YkwD